MKIEHIAIWTIELERMREFYQHYFNMECGDKYVNHQKGFSSYFLSFKNGTRIELMNSTSLKKESPMEGILIGYAHLAISVGSKDAVDELSERLRQDGYEIAGEPRYTGDGYYESIIKDPDGNLIEITE